MAEPKDEKKTAQEFVESLTAHRSEIEKVIYKPYGRIFLEAAIPTALVIIGVVSVTAAIVLIDRRVGVDPQSPTKSEKNTE